MPKRPVPATILPTEPSHAAAAPAPAEQPPAAPAPAHEEPPVEPAHDAAAPAPIIEPPAAPSAEPASEIAPPSAEESTTAHVETAPKPEPTYIPDEPPAINSLPAGTRLKEIDIPLKKYAGSYIPTSLNLTLTPSQARALVNFGEGLRSLNVRVDHPADALKRFLERIAD